MTTPNHHEDAGIRASDGERDHVIALLREAAGEGRLDVDELEGRLERAHAARTRADLAVLTRDLPRTVPASARPVRRSPQRGEFRRHASVFVLVNVLLFTIWAASGGGYFWPVWPMLGWGIGLAKHASAALRPAALPGAGARTTERPWAG